MNRWQTIDDNLTTASYFVTSDYHEDLRRLRREDPVHWTMGKFPRGFWSILTYADSVRVLEDTEAFSSRYGGILPNSPEDPTPEVLEEFGSGAIPSSTDPPLHLKVRQPFNKHFTAPAMARLKNACQKAIDRIIDEVLPRGECDLVEDVTAKLPVALVCDMMGIPEEDRARIKTYCTAFMGALDPQYQIDGDVTKTERILKKAVFDYVFELAQQRRLKPTDDFTSLVGNMVADGRPLTDREVGWWCFSLVMGGLETTRNALTVGFLQLMKDPEQAAMLRANPALGPTASEEIIRWGATSKHKFRIATKDVEIGGKLIKANDWVVPWLASANRDETVFKDPDRFDITRSPNPHIGFGAGPHSCLGRHLARMELSMMLNTVLHRIPDMQIAGEYEWLESNNSSGLKSLPVTFKASRTLAA